jgi:hypothetical protein
MGVTPYPSRLIIVMAVTVLSTQGCTSLIPSSQKGTATEYSHRCGPAIVKTRPHRSPVQFKSTVPVEPSVAVEQQLSPVARRIAETIEALTLLNALLDSPPRSTLELVILRLQLMERTQLATLEVDSAIAEIVCERDRADQLADRIDEVDGARVKRLTIASFTPTCRSLGVLLQYWCRARSFLRHSYCELSAPLFRRTSFVSSSDHPA